MTDDDALSIEVSIGDRGPVEVKEDGFIVIRLTADDISDELVIEDSDGVVTETTSLDLSGLSLEEAPEVVEEEQEVGDG